MDVLANGNRAYGLEIADATLKMIGVAIVRVYTILYIFRLMFYLLAYAFALTVTARFVRVSLRHSPAAHHRLGAAMRWVMPLLYLATIADVGATIVVTVYEITYYDPVLPVSADFPLPFFTYLLYIQVINDSIFCAIYLVISIGLLAVLGLFWRSSGGRLVSHPESFGLPFLADGFCRSTSAFLPLVLLLFCCSRSLTSPATQPTSTATRSMTTTLSRSETSSPCQSSSRSSCWLLLCLPSWAHL